MIYFILYMIIEYIIWVVYYICYDRKLHGIRIKHISRSRTGSVTPGAYSLIAR